MGGGHAVIFVRVIACVDHVVFGLCGDLFDVRQSKAAGTRPENGSRLRMLMTSSCSMQPAIQMGQVATTHVKALVGSRTRLAS